MTAEQELGEQSSKRYKKNPLIRNTEGEYLAILTRGVKMQVIPEAGLGGSEATAQSLQVRRAM